jgi:bifunctional oligoribonuclease and PAP phosphatase NrnA
MRWPPSRLPQIPLSMTNPNKAIRDIRDAILQRQRFLLTSHARPDGDAIGSQLAMAYALKALGKSARCVGKDAAPSPLQPFPGVTGIQVTSAVDEPADAVIVMECGDLARTGVQGFEKYFIINIDHHPGNSTYGAINWFDETACACGEMVFDVIDALNVPLSPEIATHIYVAILTDTGGFHYGNITPRTFAICDRCASAGANPAAIARAIYDSSTLGRLRLVGGVLHNLELEAGGRLALSHMSLQLLKETGGTQEDSDGLINMPLTVKEIEAVAFFKEIEPASYRVSMRSKGDVDVNGVARKFGGGGHRNAAGCSMNGAYPEVRARLLAELERALNADQATR